MTELQNKLHTWKKWKTAVFLCPPYSVTIVEHTLISLIGTCHCIRPRCFARPIWQHHWFCKFRVVRQKPDFILTGNCVYVGLLLIPRKKQNLTTHKTQPAMETIGCGGMNATESSCVLCCEILFFFSYISSYNTYGATLHTYWSMGDHPNRYIVGHWHFWDVACFIFEGWRRCSDTYFKDGGVKLSIYWYFPESPFLYAWSAVFHW